MSIREDPSGSIKGFEQGRGTGHPSLPLCLIEESLFGAVIHNLLRLIRSLQSWPSPVFSFQSGMGYVRILFLDVTAWSERLKLLDFILEVYSYFKSPRVDPRRSLWLH